MAAQAQLGMMRGQAASADRPRSGVEGKLASFFSTNGVSSEDIATLKEIVRLYRQSWMTNRIEQFQRWTRNELFGKGMQILGWDPGQRNWIDKLAWYRENVAQEGEDTNLEPFVMNVTLMLHIAFAATLARGVPSPRVLPADARIPRDVTTATGARVAAQIIKRRNYASKMMWRKAGCFYYYGSYAVRTRPVLDGNLGGWSQQAFFEDFEVQQPARMKCLSCGLETPIKALRNSGGGQLPRCPGCGAPLGAESLYGAGEGNYTSLRMAGTEDVPLPAVKQSVHSPKEWDSDPKLPIWESPVFAHEREIDVGEGRMLYGSPEMPINEGAVSSTSPNAEYERLRRLETFAALGGWTADTNQSSLTLCEIWMQPKSYTRTGDYGFAARMKAKFPKGLCLTTLAQEVPDIREAELRREWTAATTVDDFGPYGPAIADRVVPFNDQLNRNQERIFDFADRAALGLNVAKASALDQDKINKQPLSAERIIPIPTSVNGQALPISEIFAHYDTPMDQNIWNLTRQLLELLMIVAQVPAQLTGLGTQEGVDTMGGQQLQLGRALGAFSPFWDALKVEDAQASDNAVYWAQKLMKAGAISELHDVEQQKGDSFTNRSVSADEMEGAATFESDPNQALPVNDEVIRQSMQLIFEQIAAGNAAAIAWADDPDNQEMMTAAIAPTSKVPAGAQRNKTLTDIAAIVDFDGTWQPGEPLPQSPDPTDDFTEAKPIIERYCQEHAAELKNEKPMQWQMVQAYYDAVLDAENQRAQADAARQMKVSQAGQPQNPGMPPEVQGVVQALEASLRTAIAQLAAIGGMDPMLTKGTATAQVAANKELLDVGEKVADLVSK